MHKFWSKAKRFALASIALAVILGLFLALMPLESGATPQPLPPRPPAPVPPGG